MATVTFGDVDPNPGNNSAFASTNFEFPADISIGLDPGSTSFNVIGGTQFTITYLVGNAGPFPADNVVTTIDTNVPFGGLTLHSPTGPCALSDNGGNTSIGCDLGQLIVGGPSAFDVVVSISTPGSYNQSATISTTTSDPNSANNGPVNGTIVVN
jgi:hypothetical protein